MFTPYTHPHVPAEEIKRNYESTLPKLLACDKDSCHTCVREAINFHRLNSPTKCLTLGYHYILYVAAKKVYIHNLQHSETVGELLQELFSCDRNFNDLLHSALNGPRCHFSNIPFRAYSMWDMNDDKRDCVKALEYFLHHSVVAKVQFEIEGDKYMLQDMPVDKICNVGLIFYALVLMNMNLFSLLVKYGAEIGRQNLRYLNPPHCIHKRRCQIVREMLKRTGVDEQLPTLKNLARLNLRRALKAHFQLPWGIKHLPLPRRLIKYVSLEED